MVDKFLNSNGKKFTDAEALIKNKKLVKDYYLKCRANLAELLPSILGHKFVETFIETFVR